MQLLLWVVIGWAMTMATINYFRKSGKSKDKE